LKKIISKKKLKLCDFDGRKIDTAIISSDKEAEEVFKRWKKKGLM